MSESVLNLDSLQHELLGTRETATFFDADLRQTISRASVIISLQVYSQLRSDINFVFLFVTTISVLFVTSLTHSYIQHSILSRKELTGRLWFEVFNTLVYSVSEFFNYLFLSLMGDLISQYLQGSAWSAHTVVLYLLLFTMYFTMVTLMRKTSTEALMNRFRRAKNN